MKTNVSIVEAHKFSFKSRSSLLKSKKCGCFYCLSTFAPEKITEWVDEDADDVGQTALCPECGIDSVIGDHDVPDFDRKFLGEMRAHWFGKTFVVRKTLVNVTILAVIMLLIIAFLFLK